MAEPLDINAPVHDPEQFYGRRELLNQVTAEPWAIWPLLGGRRIGKTSFLFQLHWEELLTHATGARNHFLPVYLSFQGAVPQSAEGLLAWLATGLDAVTRNVSGPEWPALLQGVQDWVRRDRAGDPADPPVLPDAYRDWMKQIRQKSWPFKYASAQARDPLRAVTQEAFEEGLLAQIKRLGDQGFDGVIYLLDECEPLLEQDWLGEATTYLRIVKDGGPFSSNVGLVFAGARGLREYTVTEGSDLFNLYIDKLTWLEPFTEAEVRALIGKRCRHHPMTNADIWAVLRYAGRQPFLTQWLVATWLKAQMVGVETSAATLARQFQRQVAPVFRAWWTRSQRMDCLGAHERAAYERLLEAQHGSAEGLHTQAGLSENDCREALDVLSGTGVILAEGVKSYRPGAQLFVDWVRGQRTVASPNPSHGSSVVATARLGAAPALIFISYAHEDRKALKELDVHLQVASLTHLVWVDTRLPPGSNRREEIQRALRAAKIAVLLVSDRFLASTAIVEDELQPILKAAHDGSLTLFWVKVRACNHDGTDLRHYQPAHDLSRPIMSLRPAQREEAWLEVCKKILASAKALLPHSGESDRP